MLELQHVKKVFNPKTVNEKVVFTDFNLHVDDGEFVTIVGSNGAGKSTLFGLIAGTTLADEGHIFLDDDNITYAKDYHRSKYIGHLFQDPLSGTAPHMTIEENLALAYLRADKQKGILSRISKQDKKMFYEALKELDMGLEERMQTPVGLLSGGQRQALTLLMAVIVPPKLLLLDEHTAALDPKAAESIMHLTKEIIQKHHMTCLMITHNMQYALDMGSRMIMMQAGKIILDLNESEKRGMTIDDLLQHFRKESGTQLTNDRLLLSE